MNQMQMQMAITMLAKAVMRLYHSKSLHDYELIESLAEGDLERAVKLMPEAEPASTSSLTHELCGHFRCPNCMFRRACCGCLGGKCT